MFPMCGVTAVHNQTCSRISKQRWLLAFLAVVSVHAAAISAMIIAEPEVVEADYAPPSAVMVSFAPVSAAPPPTAQIVEEAQPVTRPQEPELMIEKHTNKARHKQVAGAEQHKPEQQPSPKTKEPVEAKKSPANQAIKDKAEADDVPENEAPQPQTAQSTAPSDANQQVSLQSSQQPERNAIAKRQQALAMAQWKHVVQAHLEQLKRYPLLALKQKREGVATVAFQINHKGEVLNSSLIKSSGVHLLDRATQQLIGRASPLPEPPSHITSNEISIQVPIRYFIR